MLFNWTEKDEEELNKTLEKLGRLKRRKELHEKEIQRKHQSGAWTAPSNSKLKSTF